MNAVSAVDLTKSFGPIRALDGVALEVPQGACFAIVGENGAGKTTLFSLLAGFIKPNRGIVTVLGSPPGHARLTGRVSILPQDARFLPHAPLALQLRFLARLLGFARAPAKLEAERVLSLVGLSEAAAREPSQLSHGMAKRAAIAQALLGTPDLMLLDEPTAGLDPNSARTIRDLIRSLRGKTTLLVSSHNLVELEDLCSSVAILQRGRVIEQAALEVFLERENCLTVTLDGSFALIDGLRLLPGIRGVDVIDRGSEKRLTVYVATQGEMASVQIALIQYLASHGCVPHALFRGRALEDRFLEATAPSVNPVPALQ